MFEIRQATNAEVQDYCRYVADTHEGERILTFSEWKARKQELIAA